MPIVDWLGLAWLDNEQSKKAGDMENAKLLPEDLKVTPCCGRIMRTQGTEGYTRAIRLLEIGVCPDCERVLASRARDRDSDRLWKAKAWFERCAVRGEDLNWRWSDTAALIAFSEMPEWEEKK